METPEPVIARLIAEVTKLANEDSAVVRAQRLGLIIDDLREVVERIIAAERRLAALERRRR